MNHRSVVWTRPKAKSPRALAGSWIVTGRHTSPVTRSLLSSPSQPCARAHKVSSVNNLTRRIFHRSPVSSSIDRRNRSGEGSTQAYDVFGQIETWIAIDRGKRASKVSYESLSSIFEMMYSFLLKFFSPLLAINRGNDLRSLENEACIGEPRGRYGIVTVVVGVDSRPRRVTVPCLCCTSFPDRFRGGSGPRFLHEPREKRGETDTISRRGTFSLLDR